MTSARSSSSTFIVATRIAIETLYGQLQKSAMVRLYIRCRGQELLLAETTHTGTYKKTWDKVKY